MRYWLKKIRKEKGLQQEDIAKLLDISTNYFCDIENGNRKKKLDIDLLQKLSKALKIPIGKILEYENEIQEHTV